MGRHVGSSPPSHNSFAGDIGSSKATSVGEWSTMLEVVPLPKIPLRERLVQVKRPLSGNGPPCWKYSPFPRFLCGRLGGWFKYSNLYRRMGRHVRSSPPSCNSFAGEVGSSKATSIGEWAAMLEVFPLPTIPLRETRRLVQVKQPLSENGPPCWK